MRKFALNFYACPECQGKLSLSSKREEVVFDNFVSKLSDTYISSVSKESSPARILELKTVHVKNAYLMCDSCDLAFEIHNFIPNLRPDRAIRISEMKKEEFVNGVERTTEMLPLRKQSQKIIRKMVKELLPFDKAKGEKARKNLEHDLEYRVNHAEKDKYVHLFEKYLSKNPEVVLEIGIGQGGFSSSVKKLLQPQYVFGLDYERDWLDIAKVRDFDIECVVADGRKMPFKNDAFDLMYSAYTLEHIPGVEAVVKETARVSNEAFYIFGPSSWSPFDFHFEKAPLIPMLPRQLGKKLAYHWKVARTGYDYTRKEISDEYDLMNYMSPRFFEKQCETHGLHCRSILSLFLGYSFRESYQYHPVMKIISKFGFLVIPLVKLLEALRVQPIMVYFLRRKS